MNEKALKQNVNTESHTFEVSQSEGAEAFQQLPIQDGRHIVSGQSNAQ
jgi:hypothetical protein